MLYSIDLVFLLLFYFQRYLSSQFTRYLNSSSGGIKHMDTGALIKAHLVPGVRLIPQYHLLSPDPNPSSPSLKNIIKTDVICIFQYSDNHIAGHKSILSQISVFDREPTICGVLSRQDTIHLLVGLVR